jgi:hypothetical protein
LISIPTAAGLGCFSGWLRSFCMGTNDGDH